MEDKKNCEKVEEEEKVENSRVWFERHYLYCHITKSIEEESMAQIL